MKRIPGESVEESHMGPQPAHPLLVGSVGSSLEIGFQGLQAPWAQPNHRTPEPRLWSAGTYIVLMFVRNLQPAIQWFVTLVQTVTDWLHPHQLTWP